MVTRLILSTTSSTLRLVGTPRCGIYPQRLHLMFSLPLLAEVVAVDRGEVDERQAYAEVDLPLADGLGAFFASAGPIGPISSPASSPLVPNGSQLDANTSAPVCKS